MVINRSRIKNPYLLAFVNIKNVPDGKQISTVDYMFWIDKRHAEYRRMHRIPEHMELNPAQVEGFTAYLNGGDYER